MAYLGLNKVQKIFKSFDSCQFFGHLLKRMWANIEQVLSQDGLNWADALQGTTQYLFAVDIAVQQNLRLIYNMIKNRFDIFGYPSDTREKDVKFVPDPI